MLEAHHLISRGCEEFAAEPKNGLLLCQHHHNRSPVCSPHGSAASFDSWMQEHAPEQYRWWAANRSRTRRRRKSWKEIYYDLCLTFKERTGKAFKLTKTYLMDRE